MFSDLMCPRFFRVHPKPALSRVLYTLYRGVKTWRVILLFDPRERRGADNCGQRNHHILIKRDRLSDQHMLRGTAKAHNGPSNKDSEGGRMHLVHHYYPHGGHFVPEFSQHHLSADLEGEKSANQTKDGTRGTQTQHSTVRPAISAWMSFCVCSCGCLDLTPG